MAVLATHARAVTTLTFTENGANTNTVVIGGKTYTLQTTLTNVDGNVKLGGTTAVTIVNLVAAVQLGSGAGTLYAAAMTANTQVRVRSYTATTIIFEARVPGTAGNLIASTDTLAGSSAFTSTVLAGGTGDVTDSLQIIRDECQINSEVWTLLTELIGADEVLAL